MQDPKQRIVQETVLPLHLPHTINISTSIIFHNLLLSLKHLCMVIFYFHSTAYSIELNTVTCPIGLNHATVTESG